VDDMARDQAALELLRVQRRRLADRMRWPWWYQAGLAAMYALVFAFPFISRFGHGIRVWPFLIPTLAVACLMQWGLSRATGIKVGFRNLRYPATGRPTRIAVVMVSLGAVFAEASLIRGDLIAAAIVIAAIAFVAEIVLQQVMLRGIRQELRGGGGAA
jgi:hypothetical protein